MDIVEFLCWGIVVALFAAWLLILADKWGIREWLQVHAPNDFLYKLFMCNFCCSFHLCVVISLTLLAATAQWQMLLLPFISTTIARKYYENR